MKRLHARIHLPVLVFVIGCFVALMLVWASNAALANKPVSVPQGGAAMLLPRSGMITYSPFTCTLVITTASDGIGPNDFASSARLASYLDLALAPSNVPTSPVQVQAFDEYFRLDNAVAGASYKVDAIPDYTSNYNLGLIIYNVGFKPIMTDTNPVDNNSASLTLVPDSVGPYYFKVSQITAQCSGRTYELRLTYTGPTATPTNTPSVTPAPTATTQPWTLPDQYDSSTYAPTYNDALANAVALGASTTTGLTLYNAVLYPSDPGNDQDWYTIYGVAGYQYSVIAGPDTGFIYPYLFVEVIAPDRITLVGQRSDNAAIAWTASSTGSYFIHIARATGSPTNGTYHLNWTAAAPTPTPIPLLDAYEPNETINAARPLNQSNVTGLTLFNPYLYPSDPGQDQDWYFIFANVPQVGSRYTVNAVSDNLCPVMDMDIRNPGTDLIGQALNSNTPSLSWIADRAGAYYIHIRRAANSVPCFGTYRLGWTVTKPTAEPPVSAFDVSGHSGSPPLAIWFTDQSSGVITEWLWNFGDGFTSTLRNPLHVYTVSGVYTVALTVSGPGGSHTLARSNYIHVYLPQPVFSAPVCGITNKMSLMMGGVAQYGLNITLYDNGVQLLTTSAATNTFTFALSLGSGQHIFTATASNATETSLPSYPLALTISPTLAYDPVGVTFSYAPPTAPPPATPLATPTAAPPIPPLATPSATVLAMPTAPPIPPLATPSATPPAVLTVTPTASPPAALLAAPLATLTATPYVAPTAAPSATLPAAPSATLPAAPTAAPTAAPFATPTATLPATAWGAITQHPRDSSGCANPDGWRIWLRPGYTTTIAVPISYTYSAVVTITLGNQTRMVADTSGTLRLPLTAVFTPPITTGLFAITVTADGQTSIATGSAVMDSEGYVYDKDTWDSQGIIRTLAGVTVTCQYSDTAANEWLMWQAWAYDAQVNPQETGADGYYSFFVPPGTYRITANHPDYWPYASPDIVVWDKPAHVSIPLILTRRLYLPIILRQ